MPWGSIAGIAAAGSPAIHAFHGRAQGRLVRPCESPAEGVAIHARSLRRSASSRSAPPPHGSPRRCAPRDDEKKAVLAMMTPSLRQQRRERFWTHAVHPKGARQGRRAAAAKPTKRSIRPSPDKSIAVKPGSPATTSGRGKNTSSLWARRVNFSLRAWPADCARS